MDISPLRDLPIHTILTSNPTLKPMNPVAQKHHSRRPILGFTLVEMLVVIAIMSILMTAGAIGLGGMGGKGVTSGVATAESLFDEARAIAVGQRTRARVMIAKDLTSNPQDNLRRIVIASEELDSAGTPVANSWILSSRGTLLPDQVFFSQNFSKKDQTKPGKDEVLFETLSGAKIKSSFTGEYYFYEFNAEGICATPGASFVLGSGSRTTATGQPFVTSEGKRDFGGFVIWRNGRTSIFRSPEQIDGSIKDLTPGKDSKF